MKILKNILTFLLVASMVGFLVMTSYTFGSQERIQSAQVDTSIKNYRASILRTELGAPYIAKEQHKNSDSIILQKGEAGYTEFGKLSSAFVLSAESVPLDLENFSLSGKDITFHPDYPTIFSLYDPFATYTMTSHKQDFRINEVTNGSFYVGAETDGTYSIYSIDAVIRLDFISEGEVMTDMVLFPGMYIRFDPKMNSGLKGANLFRILQALEPDGTKDITTDTTGIEFVNPRMNSSDNKDSFFMYKLPIRTNVLFQMLHILFYDQVSNIDLYKEYGTSAHNSTIDNDTDSWLVNPGKQSHFLLLKLDSVLSNALQNTVSLETFRTQIAGVNEGAHSLAVGNAVEARLENFLTDGRFALFGGSKINPQFPEIYQAVSEEVGKAPVTAHAKLLQRLSDIYSKNLVAQKKDLAFSKIDTYTPTAIELERTLDSSDIQQRDYFDIALYAFNVLKKAEDKGMFEGEAVYAHPTYSLIQTILVSTDRYVRSIDDTERRDTTYQGIALHFYEHMLGVLTRSVYDTFMEDIDGYLYLKPTFRPTVSEPKIHIDESLIRDIENIDGRLSLVSERLDAQYGKDSKNSTYVSIKKSIALFHGFARILDYEAYTEYSRTPYIRDITVTDTGLPSYSGGSLESSNPSAGIKVNGATVADPSVDAIISLLGDIPKKNIIRDGDMYRIDAAMFQFPHPSSGKTVDIELSVVFNKDISLFSNLTIEYQGKTIVVMTDKTDRTGLLNILTDIRSYIARLDTILQSNPALTGDIRFLENTKKIVIGVYPFPLVP